MKPERVLAAASYEVIRELDAITEDAKSDDVRRAARTAAQALLALRDCISNPPRPDAYLHRFTRIEDEILSLRRAGKLSA